MKIYVQNKQREATMIDTETTLNREENYCTLSGTRFDDKPLVNFFDNELADFDNELADANEITDDSWLQALWDLYEAVLGKAVPARYKNDTEWLNTKINETLTSAE